MKRTHRPSRLGVVQWGSPSPDPRQAMVRMPAPTAVSVSAVILACERRADQNQINLPWFPWYLWHNIILNISTSVIWFIIHIILIILNISMVSLFIPNTSYFLNKPKYHTVGASIFDLGVDFRAQFSQEMPAAMLLGQPWTLQRTRDVLTYPLVNVDITIWTITIFNGFLSTVSMAIFQFANYLFTRG